MRMENCFAKYYGHTQEVCGLQWNQEGTQLASGGNDSKLCIWGLGSTLPQLKLYGHSSAVKSLAWCQYDRNLLASGSNDKQIHIWDRISGECRRSADTGSQVYALEWSKHTHEIVSAHSLNQLTLWDSQNMYKVGDIEGHTARVICMAPKPGRNISGVSRSG